MKKISIFLSATALSLALVACGAPSAGQKPLLGSADAPILVELFSDYQCPACAQVSPELESIIRNNPGVARLEFNHFPLPQHENAFRAGQAAVCADQQGKFWEYGDLAYQNNTNLTDPKLLEIAQSLDLNTDTFQKCLESESSKDPVRAGLSDGRALGVAYTPYITVNGKEVRYSGRDTFEGYLNSLK